MNIDINITIRFEDVMMSRFEGMVASQLEGVKQKAQEAMAEAFYGVVMANFGSVGFDRPWDWQQLSPAYAKKVGRNFATLLVTGALRDTVKKDASDPEAATVSMGNTASVPYALAHHHGNPGNFGWTQSGSGELPARRVFPIDEADQITDRTKSLVVAAAREAVLREALK